MSNMLIEATYQFRIDLEWKNAHHLCNKANINCMFYLNIFFISYVRAQKKITQTFLMFGNFCCGDVLIELPEFLFSKVFTQAEVKHTIYVDRPNLFQIF